MLHLTSLSSYVSPPARAGISTDGLGLAGPHILADGKVFDVAEFVQVVGHDSSKLMHGIILHVRIILSNQKL